MTAAITLPLVGAAAAATKFASDFEKSTTKLVTLSGMSKSQMQEMKQAVLDMAPSVGIGPRALSEALLVVTSTGFKGAEAMSILQMAAQSSAVGMGDTKDVARALTAAVSAYGAENLTAAQAADILHATVVAGGAEATELAGELGRVVGVASQLGVSFEEVGAFIATYTRLGLSAAEATTGLSGVLNTILDPSKEARDALGGLGISADGLRKAVAEKGLGDTLTDLIGRLHGNADATGALFGNVRALAGVMGTAGVQAEGYKANLDAIRNSSGSLNRAFDETKKTFAFMWDQFKANAERAAITLGTQLLPAAEGIMRAAKPLADIVVNLVVGFSKLPQPVQTVALAFLAVVAAIGPVLIAVGQMMLGMSSLMGVVRLATPMLTGMFATSGAAAVAATAPVLGFAAAIGGLVFAVPKAVAALSNLWNVWNQFGTKGLLGELGRNVNDDSKSFFKDWRVDQQPNRRRGGAGSGPLPIAAPGALAGGAAAARMRDEEANRTAMAAGLGGGGDTTKEKARVNPFSGSDIFKDAAQAMKDIAAVGGITKLTADETKKLNGILSDALDKYGALGQKAPDAMVRVWAATMPRPEVIAGLQGLYGKDGALDIGTLIEKPIPPVLNIPGVSGGALDPSALSPGSATGILPSFKGPGIFAQMFGSSKDLGASLSSVIMQAFTGGGSAGKGIGGLLGGGAMSGIASKLMGSLGSKGIGGMLGGVLGSVIPGLGTLLGGLGGSAISGLFGKLFGGEKKKTNKARDAFIDESGGLEALKQQAEEAGFSLDKMLSTKKVKDFQGEVDKLNAAVKGHKDLVESIGNLTAGVNARAANVQTQGDLDVVGAGALASFALQMQQGTGALAAFQSITPAITAMNAAMAAGNLTVSDSVAKLMGLGLILDQNNIQFQNLGASGQILQAMLQGNIRDGALFATVATDIGTQIQTVIDRGVPMAQVFALAQPQLQALWEAQQKWGFAVDETTGHLLAEAEAQGFVGVAMKSVNEQILSVLVAIGKVLGADIPAAMAGLPAAAQAAADGMNSAFSTVRPPDFDTTTTTTTTDGADVPQMARGGIVRARSGGTLVNVGEAGRDEAIVPLGQSSGIKGGSGGVAVLEVDGREWARAQFPYMAEEAQRLGLG